MRLGLLFYYKLVLQRNPQLKICVIFVKLSARLPDPLFQASPLRPSLQMPPFHLLLQSAAVAALISALLSCIRFMNEVMLNVI